MAGIVFMGTSILEEMHSFYVDKIGMKLWLDQGGCQIYSHGNMLLGFCHRSEPQTEGIITFFFDSRAEVDAIYKKFANAADGIPRYNQEYNIYHFYSRDPENRVVEFQKFESGIGEYHTGSHNLMQRRSIREYSPEKPSVEVLNRVFEICRYSPTSMNRQKYYYVITDNFCKINKLAKVRGSSSAPLASAPYCVAVCCTHETRRVQQDADIAAVYFMLAAHSQGLGTCWITDMDRVEVKELLNIPEDDYIACVLPVGYAKEAKPLPERRSKEEFIRFV